MRRLAQPPAGNDLLTLLRSDHRSILLWLAALVDVDEDEVQRASLLEDVTLAIVAHCRAEEAVVRRAIERDPSLRVAARIDHDGHDRMERLLGELWRARPIGDLWLARARSLLDFARQHIEDEERTLFAALRTAVHGDVLRTLGGQFVTARLLELGNIDEECAAAPAAAMRHGI